MTENNNKSELCALISLLDEPDSGMYNQIKAKINSYGEQAIPLLETAWDETESTTVQSRVENIIQRIQIEKLCHDIDHWARLENHDLLKGFILVNKLIYPNIDINIITKELGRITQDIWLELNNDLTPLEKIKVFNHIIFDIQKFGPNKDNMTLPDNNCLHRLLETRRGNALSLGILYIVLGQSLRLPLYGIDLPRHFVIAYMDDDKIGTSIKKMKRKDVAFYLNPFYKGIVFSEKEIEIFVKQLKLEQEDRFYLPSSNINIISRLLNELRYSFEKNEGDEKIKQVDRVLSIINKYH
ncbi:MAG: transglutaminase-like domain-containing protein [Hyphomicrobiales bacterium]